MQPKVYPLRTGMKVFCWIMAVICVPLVVTLPGTVLMLMLALRGKFVSYDDHFEATWIMTRSVPWKDVKKVEWGRPGGGVIGALMGLPLHWYNEAGKKQSGVMVNAYEGTAEIMAAFKDKAGVAP